MRKRKKKLLTIILGMMLVLMTGFHSVLLAAASESDRVPDLSGENGSLQITVSYTDNDENVIPVQEADFSVAKVADLEVKNGSAKYTWLEQFASCGFELEGMSLGTSIRAAAVLQNMIVNEGVLVPAFMGVTDENGTAFAMPNLTPGIYLVYGFNKPKTKDGFAILSPYLIQVPNPDPTNANTWIYDVVSYPKAGVEGFEPILPDAPENGEIHVTKELVYFDEFQQFRIMANDETFYVGLFLDAEGTQLYEPGGIQTINISLSSYGEAVFTDLPPNTYYVFETLEDGTPLMLDMPSYDEHGNVFIFEMEPGVSQAVTIEPSEEGDEKDINIINHFLEFPDNYFLSGEIEIQKDVRKDGVQTTVEDTFYAGVYTANDDGSYELFNLVELEQNSSVKIEVSLGELNSTEEFVYWIFECDDDGDPVRNDKSFPFKVSGEGPVVLDHDNTYGTLELTNEVKPEGTPEETPTPTPYENPSPDSNGGAGGSGGSGGGGGSSSSNGIKTGDDTQFLPYILAMFIAVLAAGLTIFFKNKK